MQIREDCDREEKILAEEVERWLRSTVRGCSVGDIGWEIGRVERGFEARKVCLGRKRERLLWALKED